MFLQIVILSTKPWLKMVSAMMRLIMKIADLMVVTVVVIVPTKTIA